MSKQIGTSNRRLHPTAALTICVLALGATAAACCDNPQPAGPIVTATTTPSVPAPTDTTSVTVATPPTPTTARPSPNPTVPTNPPTTAVPPPQINSFSANPSSGSCTRGQVVSTTLSWSTSNASQITLDGAAVAPSGSAQKTLLCGGSRTYTLVAQGGGISKSQTTSVHFGG